MVCHWGCGGVMIMMTESEDGLAEEMQHKHEIWDTLNSFWTYLSQNYANITNVTCIKVDSFSVSIRRQNVFCFHLCCVCFCTCLGLFVSLTVFSALLCLLMMNLSICMSCSVCLFSFHCLCHPLRSSDIFVKQHWKCMDYGGASQNGWRCTLGYRNKGGTMFVHFHTF